MIARGATRTRQRPRPLTIQWRFEDADPWHLRVENGSTAAAPVWRRPPTSRSSRAGRTGSRSRSRAPTRAGCCSQRRSAPTARSATCSGSRRSSRRARTASAERPANRRRGSVVAPGRMRLLVSSTRPSGRSGSPPTTARRRALGLAQSPSATSSNSTAEAPPSTPRSRSRLHRHLRGRDIVEDRGPEPFGNGARRAARRSRAGRRRTRRRRGGRRRRAARGLAQSVSRRLSIALPPRDRVVVDPLEAVEVDGQQHTRCPWRRERSTSTANASATPRVAEAAGEARRGWGLRAPRPAPDSQLGRERRGSARSSAVPRGPPRRRLARLENLA